MHILTIWRRQLAEGVAGPNGTCGLSKDHRVAVRGGVAKRIGNCPSQMEEFANFAKFCGALAHLASLAKRASEIN